MHNNVNLGPFAAGVATLLPLAIIVSALGALSIASRITSTMGGLREDVAATTTAQITDAATTISFIALFPLAVAYAILCARPRDDGL